MAADSDKMWSKVYMILGLWISIMLMIFVFGNKKAEANTQPYWVPFVEKNSVVIRKSERKLYYVTDNGNVVKYPVAVGKATTPSPSGEYKVERKAKNPTWYPPESILTESRLKGKELPKIVPPGPDNPLGTRAIYLSANTLRIHGTNKQSSVGKAVSHGCFRMKDNDIIDLYNKVNIGTTVYVFK